MAIPGFCILGGVYLANLLLGAYLAGEAWFAVPIVGPWGYLATNRYSVTGDAGDRLVVLYFTLDGLAQTAGLVMGVAGLVAKRQVKVYEDANFTLLPNVSRDGAGLMAVGTF